MRPLDCQGVQIQGAGPQRGKVDVTNIRPTREALREFMFEQAQEFMRNNKVTKKFPRKLRRQHARALAKRNAKLFLKAVREGEINANV